VFVRERERERERERDQQHFALLTTWFTRIPYPKNGVRTTSGNESSTFTSNINTAENFPTKLSMEENVII
jgi:hypothetical protein